MKLKPVNYWEIKKGYTGKELIEKWAKCHKDGFNHLMVVARIEGQLTGENKERCDMMNQLKTHCRDEGMWLVINDLVNINPRKKEDKEDKPIKEYIG